MNARERAFAAKIKSILNGITIRDTSLVKSITGIPVSYLEETNNTIIRIRQNENNFPELLNDVLLLCSQLGCIEKYPNVRSNNSTIHTLLTELRKAVKTKIVHLESAVEKAETDLSVEKAKHEEKVSESKKRIEELNAASEREKSESKKRIEELNAAKTKEYEHKDELASKKDVIVGYETTIKLKDADIARLVEKLRMADEQINSLRLLIQNNQEMLTENLRFKNILTHFEQALLLKQTDKIDCPFLRLTDEESLIAADELQKHLASHPQAKQFNIANFIREARRRHTFPALEFFPPTPSAAARPTPYITVLDDADPSVEEHAQAPERRLVAVPKRRPRSMAYQDESTNDNPSQTRRSGSSRHNASPRSNGL